MNEFCEPKNNKQLTSRKLRNVKNGRSNAKIVERLQRSVLKNVMTIVDR